MMFLYPSLLKSPFAAIHKRLLGVASIVAHFIHKLIDVAPEPPTALPIQLPVKVLRASAKKSDENLSKVTLSTRVGGQSEIIYDYGKCVGGLPVFSVSDASCGGNDVIEIDVIYSESREGADHEHGDGPFFLFSNAMNTYRREIIKFKPQSNPQMISSQYTQDSQRYQRVILKTPNSSILLSTAGFRVSKIVKPTAVSFSCSDELLNRIWKDGVRTVQMCTLAAGEVPEAWVATAWGTRVFGQHWAPCRTGTHWGDKLVTFDVLVEERGASWGIHMVANGLIFVLDAEARTVKVCEGLSNLSTVFPSVERASWKLPSEVNTAEWLAIEVEALGSTVDLKIGNYKIGRVDNVDINPVCGGGKNTGSIAFGGPSGYVSLYRNLLVQNGGKTLYENNLLFENKRRTFADFAVGTNQLACTIDGAKRDRAIFAGDLYVMGRSISSSTLDFGAIKGGIELLASHQTRDGYLGNLCPIQAPVHTGLEEPPTDSFYSLSYSLFLVVCIKDYWLQSGDEAMVRRLWPQLAKLIAFTMTLIDGRGLVVAAPSMSLDWFPLGGPIFGASSKINLAFYEALTSMVTMSKSLKLDDSYTSLARSLKQSMLQYLLSDDKSLMRMSDTAPHDGVCQDVAAYAVTTGVAPILRHDSAKATGNTESLLAFRHLPGWDRIQIVSPYASGFEAESQFHVGDGGAAVNTIKQVWGSMADYTSPNYSGAHWEAMKPDGQPFGHDTSLSHGWSTWPVFLLPRYLCGVGPVEAGWKVWHVKPVLAGLAAVDVEIMTVAGLLSVSLRIEPEGMGKIAVLVPEGTVCEIHPPLGWIFNSVKTNSVLGNLRVVKGDNSKTVVSIARL